ncbi:HNH endonuclease [Bacillus amyloliquefaciens]|nr:MULTISPECIES: HNH endonuclease [Bacillus amyloliquefaciens group]MCX2822932.1 HNH endonuclease [Bacillus sp. H1F1]MDF4212704.1 HNH endonuclease [Bacillus amyloliquefaciens]MDH3098437.1 HNH endonuclease [Bacillus velezensis]MDL0426887.1 HNH endonuclease [Bacillus amyloliquefaciens]
MSRKNKLTWHELNDVKTMQLVPTKINSEFGHLGGVGEINAGAFNLKQRHTACKIATSIKS